MTRAKFDEVTKRKKAEQPSQRGTLEHRRQQRLPGTPCRIGPSVAAASTASEAEAEADSTAQTNSQRVIPVLTVDFCFIGGEMTANESLVLVETDTNMVSAHVRKRKGAELDILETLMEDTEVLGQRQAVFKSDQENPVEAIKRELAARRPVMTLENRC